MEIRIETAGESHGKVLTAILHGLPAGSPVDEDRVNALLKARQGGLGASVRQKTEKDQAVFLSGVRDGLTTGNPIAIQIANRDTRYEALPPVLAPRPGHADLAGSLNRGLHDARNVVERASARETAVRTAGGAVAQQLLAALGIGVLGRVVELGGIDLTGDGECDAMDDFEAARARRSASDLHALCAEAPAAEAAAAIQAAHKDGDTLGGVIEVVAVGVPPGLGGHERPETKLSTGLAAAVMGIQAVKGVEIGHAFEDAKRRGSEIHDPILPPKTRPGPPIRPTNRAGGIEGGTSNGEAIVIRAAMKPLATLRKPLPSVDLTTGEVAPARVERSDVTAVPRLAIVAEAVVALELARHVMRRFGGASLEEVRDSIARHRERVAHLLDGKSRDGDVTSSSEG